MSAETEKRYTASEWRLIEDLRKNWHAFCDADPFEGAEDFVERMEQAGYAHLVPVDDDALQDPFAYERGIVPGGSMWQLTDAGQEALRGSP